MSYPGAILHQINRYWRLRRSPSDLDDPTFGKTDIGGSTDYWFYKIKCKYTLTEPGNVTKITAYMRSQAGDNMKAFIYDAADERLKGLSVSTWVDYVFAWYDFNFSPPVSLAPGDYWLGVLYDPDPKGMEIHYYFDPGETNQFAFGPDGEFSPPSDPEATPTYRDEAWSIYATYTVPVVPGVKALIGGLYLVSPF